MACSLQRVCEITTITGKWCCGLTRRILNHERICRFAQSLQFHSDTLVKCVNCSSAETKPWYSICMFRTKYKSKFTVTDNSSKEVKMWNVNFTGLTLNQIRSISTSSATMKGGHSTSSDFDAELEEILNAEANKGTIQDEYLLPGSGHKVFVIQPEFKHSHDRCSKLTTTAHKLAEACTLVESLPRWTVVDKAIINMKNQDSPEMFGKGNFAKLKRKVRSSKTYTAVFLSFKMLTGDQLAALQDAFDLPVYDRYTIVLQIFKIRAKTKEARLQVALAEIPYFRSRMHGIHSGTLDRQRGGAMHIGGAGETYMEVRQRLLHQRERKIKKALARLKQNRDLLKKGRAKQDYPLVAVVGYTNAGKTSLIKALTQNKDMLPRDQLFATLDVTLHAGLLPNHMKVLYVDTVGFISDIPTSLIASFSATLEDVVTADVIVHVRDISHPDTLAQRHNVIETLQNLHLPQELQNSIIEVCNKVDCIEEGVVIDLPEECVSVSATEGYGLQELANKIQDTVVSSTGRLRKCMKIPMNGPHLSWLYKQATVEKTEACHEDPEFLIVHSVMTETAYHKFVAQFGNKRRTKMKSTNGS